MTNDIQAFEIILNFINWSVSNNLKARHGGGWVRRKPEFVWLDRRGQ